MRFRCILALVVAAILTAAPALAQSEPAPPVSPLGKPAILQGAHIIVVDGSAQHELTADAVQIAHSEMGGMKGGNMMGSMATNMALSAASIVAGPVAAVAAPIISLFNHHSAPKPTMHMLLALAGNASSYVLSSAAPSFTIDYADIPGINPDAYAPELVKLTQTNDNWRVVATSESSDPSAFASLYTNGMVPAGMTGSLSMNFSPSAIGCNSP